MSIINDTYVSLNFYIVFVYHRHIFEHDKQAMRAASSLLKFKTFNTTVHLTGRGSQAAEP